MGGDMSKVVQGVYIGSYGNAANEEHLDKFNITHILAVHNLSEEAHKKHKKSRVHKRICISDVNMENISKYFSECNDFIHEGRLSGGNCLIHCQVGISRSVSITCAYLMCVTKLNFRDTLLGIQGVRQHANPNAGFRDQLVNFERTGLKDEQQRLIKKYGESPFYDKDLSDMLQNMELSLNREKEPIKLKSTSTLDRVKDILQIGSQVYGENVDPKHITPTVKHGGGSVMVWGCFSYYGVERLVFIDGRMDSGMYCNILANNLSNSVQEMGLSDYIFQQDNDSKHTSKLVKTFLEEKNIKTLMWPPQSSDMNPIETLWAIIKDRVAKIRPKNITELKKSIVEIWNETSLDLTKKLVSGFKDRAFALYRAKGMHTKY